jgi:hyperosmotically inducible protein
MKSKFLAVLLLSFVPITTGFAKSGPASDNMLIDQIRIKLAGDQVVKGGALQVDVKDGVVTLSGPVEEPKQKERAERLARKIRGVKQVINNISFRK